MLCIKCKNEIPDQSKSCPNCGEVVAISNKNKTIEEPDNANEEIVNCWSCKKEIKAISNYCIYCGKKQSDKDKIINKYRILRLIGLIIIILTLCGCVYVYINGTNGLVWGREYGLNAVCEFLAINIYVWPIGPGFYFWYNGELKKIKS